MTFDEQVQAAVNKAVDQRLFEHAMDLHESYFGVPCGPTLAMTDRYEFKLLLDKFLPGRK